MFSVNGKENGALRLKHLPVRAGGYHAVPRKVERVQYVRVRVRRKFQEVPKGVEAVVAALVRDLRRMFHKREILLRLKDIYAERVNVAFRRGRPEGVAAPYPAEDDAPGCVVLKCFEG